MTSPLILENISKSFSGKPAVRDVSFEIQAGQIIGFLGPNGAGKTTSVRMALGMVKPDSGQVSLFGQRPGPESFGRIGFLPEERGLYKKQTARDSIAFLARLNGMARRRAYERADELLEKYGLVKVARKKNKTMSKGMAQKVQLLAAIAHEPEFYILDEPFSGLDPVNQQLLEDMIRDLATQGATVLFSTHVMEHAERLCDQIILMSQGQKIFDGNIPAALSHAPRRLLIGSEDTGLRETIRPFAKDVSEDGPNLLKLTLKRGVDTQDILVKAVADEIKLSRFEPQRASLHEAFVALVGEDAKMMEREK